MYRLRHPYLINLFLYFNAHTQQTTSSKLCLNKSIMKYTGQLCIGS